jgi:Helix-turn-helix domain
MPPRITRARSREHVANRRFPAGTSDPGATDAVMVTSTHNVVAAVERMLTTSEASKVLRLSESWLAKARMRGDGPPYAQMGRSIRYPEGGLVGWIKTNLRLSTSER